MPETNPAAAMPPPQGAGQPQPPMGASQMTGPTPNRGYEAAALQRLGLVVNQLTELLPMAGATSETGAAILKALGILTKLVPSGSVTPAAQRNNIEQMAMRNTANNGQMQALKQMSAQQAGGAPPKPPMAA